MDAGRDMPVVWVTGPPGSGKTTLVASYLDTRKLSCLWYQADSGDADIATFFYYMGMAAKKAFPRKRKPLPLLTPEYLPNISVFTQRYFEELYGRLTHPFAIIFDNYQDAPAESKFHDIISIGLSVIPEGIHGIVISRNDPLPAFSRLRANNKIHFIGWNELRLTLKESEEIARMKGKRSLTHEILAALHKKTDGWVAGLVLLMATAKIQNIGYPLLKDITPQEIFDYFANEVFEKTDKQTLTFLLKTAFLPRMTAPMAEKLTGLSNSGQILSDLNKNHYFTTRYGYKPIPPSVTVSSLEEKRKPGGITPAYQYHPLFREFLMSRAGNTLNQSELTQTQQYAAEILEESGLVEDAAALLRDAKDWDRLSKLIIEHSASMVAHGRNKTVEEWIVSIPEEVREHTPWLIYWLGICRLPDNPTESRNCFDRAFGQFRSQGEQTGMWLSWSYAVRTFFHEFENFSPLDNYIALFNDLFQEETTFPSLEVEFRVVSHRFIIMMFREQYHTEIGKLAEQTLSLLRECRDLSFRLQTGYYLAVHYMWKGDFKNAGMVISTVNEGIQLETILPLERLLWETTKAMYAWLTGDNSSCLQIVSDALKLAGETGVHIWDHHLLSHGICASLSAGDIGTATELLRNIEPGLVHARKIDVGFYHFLCAWKDLIRGDVPSSAEHIKISIKAVVEVNTYFPIAVGRVAMAQVFAAMGNYHEALTQLNLAKQINYRVKSDHIEFMCLLTETQFVLGIRTSEGGHWRIGETGNRGRGDGEKEGIGDKQGGTDGQTLSLYVLNRDCLSVHRTSEDLEKHGLTILRKAMKIGREQGIVNCFGWRPDVMPRLCMKALEAGIEVEYVRDLIRKRNLIPDDPPLECENWPWPLRLITLGRFDILREDESLRFTGKVQRKPLELLKIIISFGGKSVSVDRITDILWPDTEGDMAHQSFETTVHRLRRLLGNDMAIGLQGGQLTLDARYCWVDTWAFERLYEQIESLFKSIGELETERNVEILKSRTHNFKSCNQKPAA